MEHRIGFGITAGRRAWLAMLATRLEGLGYDSLWSNDTRAGSGLATLAAGSEAAQRLDLGVGVVGLSERTAASIAEEVARHDLTLGRLVIGVGSGTSRSLAIVAEGVLELRRLLPTARIGVGALGPRMCRLAGELADVVLLNWALPERIAEAREWIAEGAGRAGRPVPRVAAYIRVAIGTGAEGRLRAEQDRYLGRTRQYREALGGQADRLVGIAAEEPSAIRDQLEPYRSVLDETIVRGLPAGDGIEDWLAIAEAAAGA